MGERIFPIIFFANEIFFEDSISDSEERYEMNFAEESVPRMNTHQFKRHFRMNPDTFEDLVGKIHYFYRPNNKGHPEICFEKATMITVWYIANIESFR